MRALVRNGRLVMDEPTDLPEGTEVELFPADSWDALEEADRRRLHEALVRSDANIRDGKVMTSEEFLSALDRLG